MRPLVFLLLLCVSAGAAADRGFFIKNVIVKDVANFNDGKYNAVMVRFMTDADSSVDSSVSCSPTVNPTTVNGDDVYIVTYWSKDNWGGFAGQRFPFALAAKLQGSRVDIAVDTGICNTGRGENGWGNKLMGIRVR